MLTLVASADDVRTSQEALAANLGKVLSAEQEANLGRKGGTIRRSIRTNGDGSLFWAYIPPTPKQKTLRHWNAFGILKAGSISQDMAVQVNISLLFDPGVGGAVGRSSDGSIWLLHNGAVGGGGKGIGKSAFVAWYGKPTEEVLCPDGKPRAYFRLAELTDPELTTHVAHYAAAVLAFKDEVRNERSKLGRSE